MANRIPSFRPSWLQATAKTARKDYDRQQRNKVSTKFYRSARWLKTRAIKLAESPLCERCQEVGRLIPANIVHHRQELTERPDLALDLDNLESLCQPCHSRHHARS